MEFPKRIRAIVSNVFKYVKIIYRIASVVVGALMVLYVFALAALLAFVVYFEGKPISTQEYTVAIALNATGAVIGVGLGMFLGGASHNDVDKLEEEIIQLREVIENQNTNLLKLTKTVTALAKPTTNRSGRGPIARSK
jgi:hypothetical protein